MNNDNNNRSLLRHLPSVDKLLLQAEGLVGEYGRLLTTEALRHTLEQQRQLILSGGNGSVDADVLLSLAHGWLD
ncbi:MAG: hypothetical protein KDE56_31480, partial [Anaerolineales bacterium]|nr:hypothetical protein [Anaerolineales bacterium]